MLHRSLKAFLFILLVCFAFASTSFAGVDNADVVIFEPANDGGRYITQRQSSTLQQWRFNVGAYFDYAFEPLEFADQTGTRRAGIVDDLLMANLGAALGLTDWWQLGVNVPVAIWETFYDPNALAAAVSKQNLFGKPGDPRIDMKFRLLDIDRYRVGLALVPFFYFPLGTESKFLGNDMWSGGGTFVVDFDIKNRVFITLNAGYRNYKRIRYDAGNANAILDDTINLGTGLNVRINDEWAVIGEIYSESVWDKVFKNQLQNPVEGVAAVRYSPQSTAKGLSITAGGGRGITTGIGSPQFRAFLGVNYRKPAVVELPEPVSVEAVVEEKIVITQRIHFEFDKSVIREISYPILDDVATLLHLNPQIQQIRVEGHTDFIGGDDYNLKLSQKRADSVRTYLIGKGIAAERLVAIGYGETKPIADNNTTRGRARNRRVEFTVIE